MPFSELISPLSLPIFLYTCWCRDGSLSLYRITQPHSLRPRQFPVCVVFVFLNFPRLLTDGKHFICIYRVSLFVFFFLSNCLTYRLVRLASSYSSLNCVQCSTTFCDDMKLSSVRFLKTWQDLVIAVFLAFQFFGNDRCWCKWCGVWSALHRSRVVTAMFGRFRCYFILYFFFSQGNSKKKKLQFWLLLLRHQKTWPGDKWRSPSNVHTG